MFCQVYNCLTFPDEFESFESPKLLIQSAKKNLSDLEGQIVAAIDAHTYTIIRNVDNKTGDLRIKLRFDKKLPPILRFSATKIITDLRNALDQVVCDAASAMGMIKIDSIYFPFAKDVQQINGRIKQACGGVPIEIIDLVKTFQPYNGGDSLLWGCSKLANKGKHQRALNLVPLAENWIINNSDGMLNVTLNPGDILGINKMTYLRNELEFARISPGGHFDMNFGITIGIFIGEAEPEALGGKPILAVLNAFSSKVESIVLAIEAETNRILATKL